MTQATCALFLVVVLAGMPGSSASEEDPLEPINRPVFQLNDGLDRTVLEPVAQGWDAISSESVRVHLDQLIQNLRFPVRFVGTLLQGRLMDSGEELGRFVVNSTVGVAGIFDPASGLGLEQHDEDFGQALGRWGTPSGPYLVLPLFGPSSPRDALGRLVDSALGQGTALIVPAAGVATFTVDMINSRALALEDVREARAASLDFYAFARNGYQQRREVQIRNGQIDPEEPSDDLYELEEDAH